MNREKIREELEYGKVDFDELGTAESIKIFATLIIERLEDKLMLEIEERLTNNAQYKRLNDSLNKAQDKIKELEELILHLYVNYELLYGKMDIETKGRMEKAIKAIREVK